MTTMRLRNMMMPMTGWAAWGLLTGLILLAWSFYPAARAEEAGRRLAVQRPRTVGALPAAGEMLRTELTAGRIHATLSGFGGEGRYLAGSSAFARIELTNGDKRARPDAQLLLESEHAEIVAVTGAGAKIDNSGSQARATIRRLRSGRQRSLLVEIRLREAANHAPNRLRVTLRDGSPGADAGGQDSTVLSWPVRDCAGAYTDALHTIADGRAGRLVDMLKEAAQPDGARGRRWLFPPDLRRRRLRGLSREQAARRKREQEILLQANRIIRARGADPGLSRRRDTGWRAYKVASDLTLYLKQPHNPAICTGALGLADYYVKNLGGLKTRAETVTRMAQEARALALARTVAARDSARALTGGHPAWGGSGLAAATPLPAGDRSDPWALAVTLADLAGVSGRTLRAMGKAGDGLEALARLRDGWRRQDIADDALRARITGALSAVEAAIHLDGAARRIGALTAAYFGSFDAIRAAHGEHCVCGG